MFDLELSKYKNNICLISEEQSLSYNEVDEICQEFEKVIPSTKELILMKSKSNIETIIGYLTALRTNQAFIMIDGSLNQKILDNILNTYQPTYVWENIEEPLEYIFTYKNYGLRKLNNKQNEIHPDLSLMLSTSGTTGSPKMVKLTKQNIYANCNSIVEYLKINSSHTAITNLPLYYSYGLSIINTHLQQGASIVVTNKSVMSKEFWEIFKSHEVTTLNGVPYNYEVFRRIGLMKMDLPSLKYMTQAGGKLNERLVKEYATWAKEKGIDFYVMYGQTEATARISYLPPKDTLKKIKSIGIPIPDGELLIKDLISEELIDKSFVDGELIYKGKNVMMGYATCKEDLAKGDELKGLLHTGDVAHRDDDGYFYITGRLKRFIKIHGNRVGLDEIEQYLKSNSFDSLCTGVDNKLMIVSTNKEDLDDIKNSVIKHFKLHHSVVKVKYLENFPVTNSGKIKYQDIIKVFE